MSKILEKVIKDAMEDGNCSLGAKEVVTSIKNSKLVIFSDSVPKNMLQKINDAAKGPNVPIINFKGSSVALGRLCGMQFRISTLSLKSLSDANLKSILKESTQEA